MALLRNYLDMAAGHSIKPSVGAKVMRHVENTGDHGKCIMGNRLTLMCPQCYSIYRCQAEGHISVSTLGGENVDLLVSPRIHIQCEHCDHDGDAIILDDGIAQCVAYLNMLGCVTEMSCDGHKDDALYNNGIYRTFIKFEKQVVQFEVPIGWAFKGLFLESYNDSYSKRNLAIESLEAHLARLVKDIIK